MTKVKLTDLTDAIELCSDLGEAFVNLKTGEACFISEEAISIAEEDESEHSYPEWQKEDVNIAKHYLENPDDYLALPSQHEINEYQMMGDFAAEVEDEKISGQLLIALRGQGAFRRFKDSVNLLGIEKEWYKFRDGKYKQFITEWCKENKIALEE